MVSLYSSEQYHVLIFDGRGVLTVDFTDYPFDGKVIYFASPYQHFKITAATAFPIHFIAFHGDFYCIEYHKEEVACNGLLFNNIFYTPHICLEESVFEEFAQLTHKLSMEIAAKNPHSIAVIKAYLQLILAIASKIKNEELGKVLPPKASHPAIEKFKPLLEEHFITHRQVSFYANELVLTPSVFTKKSREFYGKSPSHLIQDRVILEAKKLIHLTRKSMKEIAAILNFKDEHYFSRYFKKKTGITPSLFREKVGISIVADLSTK